MTRNELEHNIRDKVNGWTAHQLMGVDKEKHQRDVSKLDDADLLAYYNYLFPLANVTVVDPRPKLYFPPKEVLYELLQKRSDELLGKKS